MPKHAHGPPDASAVDFKNGEETPTVSVFKPLLCSGIHMFKKTCVTV